MSGLIKARALVDLAGVGFRLTLTSAMPVTTADVTAAGTLYCTPYKGNRIALYNGAIWIERASAEFSLALAATSGKPYDVFCYDNAGVPALETLVWTNDTTRATALALQDGVLCKSGALTRRYLGSFYASGANVTEDSFAKRYLWNFYNRALRGLRAAAETANTWAYATAATRQANANAANQLELMRGLDEDAVDAEVMAQFSDATAGSTGQIGVGLDSTTTFATGFRSLNGQVNGGTYTAYSACQWKGFPGVGRHFLAWLERGGTLANVWAGDGNVPTLQQAGIHGTCWA